MLLILRILIDFILTYHFIIIGPYQKPLLESLKGSQFSFKLGKLACSLDGAGKRRVFAIGNYVKQRLLRPYHDWLMTVLRHLPCDGTYDQGKPLNKLLDKLELYSFDLSAATDRWPLVLLYHIMMLLFGPDLASSMVNSTLGLNTFSVCKPMVKRTGEVEFVCGQPLGYYSSWPLFALSHHWIVWLAAERVRPCALHGKFNAYAILGDDVVIADSGVANQYCQILDSLGVNINKSKSLISKCGGF